MISVISPLRANSKKSNMDFEDSFVLDDPVDGGAPADNGDSSGAGGKEKTTSTPKAPKKGTTPKTLRKAKSKTLSGTSYLVRGAGKSASKKNEEKSFSLTSPGNKISSLKKSRTSRTPGTQKPKLLQAKANKLGASKASPSSTKVPKKRETPKKGAKSETPKKGATPKKGETPNRGPKSLTSGSKGTPKKKDSVPLAESLKKRDGAPSIVKAKATTIKTTSSIKGPSKLSIKATTSKATRASLKAPAASKLTKLNSSSRKKSGIQPRRVRSKTTST